MQLARVELAVEPNDHGPFWGVMSGMQAGLQRQIADRICSPSRRTSSLKVSCAPCGRLMRRQGLIGGVLGSLAFVPSLSMGQEASYDRWMDWRQGDI